MPAKKKSSSALTRQLSAARKARTERRWETAIANYTRALSHKKLSAEVKIELLEGRASCYKKSGQTKDLAADLETLSALLKSENDLLINETAQSNAELAVITSVQDALVKELDLMGIFRTVGQKILENFNAQTVTIRSFDVEKGIAYFDYILEKGKELSIPPGPISNAAKYILRHGKPFLLNEGVQQFMNKHRSVIQAGEMPKSFMAVPYKRRGPLKGGITIESMDRENAFSQSDVRLLETIANSMAVALDSALLFDEIQKRNREINETLEQQSATSEILRAMANSPSDLQPVLVSVASNAARLCEANDVQIYSVENDRLRQIAHWGPLPALNDGESLPLVRGLVAGHAVLDQKTIHTVDSRKLSKKEYPESVKLQRRLGHRTVLVTPLVRGGKAIGVIAVRRNVVRPFTEKQISLLATFADQAAIAIENVRLFDETNQRNAELAVINSVQHGLASSLKLAEIIDLIGGKIGEIFNADTALAVMYDAHRDWGINSYYVDKGRRLTIPDGPVPRPSLYATVVDSRKPLLIKTMKESEKLGAFKLAPSQTEEDQNESILFVPILTGEKVIGGISVQSYRPNAFNENDLSLLETLASSMSVALENARLFDETAQRNAELAVINSVQEAMAKQTDIQAIYEAVGEKIKEIFQAQAVILGAFDHAAGLVHPHYFYEKGERFFPDPFPFTGLIKHQISTRETVVINEGFEAKVKEFGMVLAAGVTAKSAIFVPLLAGNNVFGAISLQNIDRENAFSESDVRLLETLANSMSVALENARLFDETAQRNAELAVINSVQEAMAKQQDIKGIYEAVGEKIKDIFDAQSVSLDLFDVTSNLVVSQYLFENGERLSPKPGPFSGLTKQLIATQETIVINQNLFEIFEKEYGYVHDPSWGEPTKSGIWCPLVIGEKVIGEISLQNIDRENAFSASDVRLLETIASGMSVALENARLFDETAQRNAELAVINSVQEAIARQMDMQGIYEAVGEKIKDIFDAQSVLLATLDQASNLIIARYSYEKGERLYPSPTPGGKFAHDLIASRKTIVVNEGFAAMQAEYGFEQQPDWGERPKSAVFVPLIARDNLIGMISIQNVDKEKAFSESDVRLLETLANSMSVALENARLFDETAQRNAELAVINTVQAALADELDIQTIYDTVGEKLREIFHVGAITINVYDLEADTNSYVYGFEEGRRLPNITVPINDMHRYTLEHGGTFLINEGFQEYAARFGAKAPQGKLPKSGLSVLLPKRGNRITAVILMDIEHENAFSQSDVRLLETLASSMSAALENARLLDESNRLLEQSRKKEAELTTVNTVGQAVTSELELDALIQLIGEQVRNIFKADIAYLALYDEADGMIRFPYIQGEILEPMKLGEGIVSRVIQSGEPLLINRDQGWKEAEQTVDRIGVRSKSFLGVPIQVGKSTIGAISVQSTQKEGRFDEADMHLLSTIAANVGTAIENARLFAEVARQKEYFETFFQYSPAAVVVVDFNGTVISWNPAAESLFGYSAQEAVGQDVDDLVANDPRVEAEARGHTRKFTKELGRVEVKGRRTRKDGSLVDVEIKGLPISVEGEMVGLLVIYHDISEIEQARRAAEEANQAKSAFLANMSHELRTPLNAIIGFTRIVRRKGDGNLPEKQLENLDKVLVSAEHLLGLINTILDIAKIEAGRMELQLSDFDLSALIDSCLATTQPLVKTSGVELNKSMPQDLPKMHSDQEKIRQILLNLLSNAAKFTHKGSIKVDGELKGETITLSVKDTGIGIAEENMHKIFEEFQQADNTTTRQYGGTGLGLSISRSLARLLGGDLTASSVEGDGSIFSLTIPMQLGGMSLGSDGKEELGEVDKSIELDKPLVLVIDDQPDMFHIMQQNLEAGGYHVVGALSGEEGIEKARALHPFAITLDIMMPRKDGWQVLYDLKNDPETKDIPVIILTIVDNKPMGFRLGASDYLVKPLSEKLILEALERVTKSNGGMRPRRLLVVDDDPKVIDMIQQMLQGQDFFLDTAKDGAEALERMEQKQPEVILLDLIMPKMDGFQFIQEVQKKPKLRSIPIIVLTAKSLSNEESSQLQKSVAKIVKKQGLGSEALIEEIQRVIA